MRTLMTSALLLFIASSQAQAQFCPECRCGCPCDPGFNWYDWASIDFTTGLPHCLTRNGSCPTERCSPFDLYYARSIAGFNPNGFDPRLTTNGFQYPFPFPNGYANMNNNGLGLGFGPNLGGPMGGTAPCVGYPARAPLPPAPAPRPHYGHPPMAPVMHTPKAGPPVVDAVDPFSVSKESTSNINNSRVATKAAEFELPRVNSNNSVLNTTVDTKEESDISLPTPPSAPQAAPSTSSILPFPGVPVLPQPRFVPSRGRL